MSLSPREAEEALARQRFVILTALRFGGVALTMVGFAIVRGVIDAPYAVGAVLAVAGVADISSPRGCSPATGKRAMRAG